MKESEEVGRVSPHSYVISSFCLADGVWHLPSLLMQVEQVIITIRISPRKGGVDRESEGGGWVRYG